MTDTQGTIEDHGAFIATLKSEAAQAAQAERRQGGLKDLAAQRGESFAINPYVLQVEEGWNSRDFDRPDVIAHIDDVARSIQAQGFLRQHPITTVWKAGVPYIRDGECRWRGALRAIEHYGVPLKTVWAVTTDRASSELDLLARQGLANLSKAFSPLEKATHYAKMLRYTTGGSSVSEVAKAVGVSETAVQRLLDLYAAPDVVKDLVRQERVSVDVALDAVKQSGGDAVQARATLDAAVAVAQINGSEKATAKHVRALREGTVEVRRRKAVDRDAIRRILQAAKVKQHGDNHTVVVVENLHWDILKETFEL